MPRPLQVFLCHASQDKPEVWKLHRYLKGRGVKPWLDQADLMPGQNWEIEIPKALFASDVILVCLSKNSVNKEGYVQKEIVFALDKALEKPEGTIFIIPVKLEECEIPNRLSRYQWVNYYRPDGRKRLLMGLNLRVADLGDEVSPILVEETKQRILKPHKVEIKQEEPVGLIPSKEDFKEESKQENSVLELKKEEPEESVNLIRSKENFKEELAQETPAPLSLPKDEIKQENIVPEVKKVEKKPFTKVLDPSSLNSSQLKENKQNTGKPVQSDIFRWIGTDRIIFIVLLIILACGTYIFNNLPPTETPIITAIPTTSTPELTKTFAPTLTFSIGSTTISEKDRMTLVYVPAGEFTMGSSFNSDVKPIHTVSLGAFWIDQTEVTNALYAICILADECDQPSSISSYTRDVYFGNLEFDNYPVINVSWEDAKTYCLWADRRLPTEAEWEKASRGTDGRTYPWGNESPNSTLLNYNRNIGDTTEVGKYPEGASIYGALDMSGNVWEWVSSSYQPYPYNVNDGRENLSSLASHVLRGGSWGSNLSYVRSADRGGDYPTLPSSYLGFRCATDAE